MTNEEMTIEEAIEYFTNRNADIESAAMDENRYHYGKKQIEDVRMRREFEANELAINALEEQKNITNEKIEQTSWVVGKDGAKIAFLDMPVEKAIQICEILDSDMREPTEEERKSTTKYIDSISKPTGVIPKDVLDKIRAEIAEYGSIMVAYAITKDTKTDKGIEKLVSDVLSEAKRQVLDIIDKYKAESEGKE